MNQDDSRFEDWWNRSPARRGLSETAKSMCRTVWFAALEDDEDRQAEIKSGQRAPAARRLPPLCTDGKGTAC